MQDTAVERHKPIAFFDSGVGGLTVLALAARMLPAENFLYFGDTANAPYGGKTKAQVRELSLKAAEMLVSRGCKALVVACNTATSAAVDLLRTLYTIPVVGMEPAVKPALARGGKTLVMATPLTLREEKFRLLCSRFAAGPEQITVLPCTGLVELIEQGETEGPRLEQKLAALLSGVDLKAIETVVLGCTHYLFVRDALKKLLPPDIILLDGNAGTVRRLQHVLAGAGLLRRGKTGGGQVELSTSGGAESLSLLEKLYHCAYQQTEGLV